MGLREAKIVEFETARIIAHAQANVSIQKAVGEQYKIAQNGRADATIIENFLDAEKSGYSKVQARVGLAGDNLVKYVWFDTLAGGAIQGDHSGNMTMMLGMKTSEYVPES